MNFGLAILIVIFIAFLVILLFNPNLTCFGRRLRSPFYPLRRRRLMARKNQPVKTEDYGFKLVEGEAKPGEGKATSSGTTSETSRPVSSPTGKPGKPKKTEDYGFKLD